MNDLHRTNRSGITRRGFLAALTGGAGLAVLGPTARAAASDKPFTIVMLPDTQVYSEKLPKYFRDQTKWIVANAKKENIVFVTHVGDIVQFFGQRPAEWKLADECMSMLDGVVPWGVAIGNHDYDVAMKPEGKTFVKHFGPQRFAKCDWYGGASPNGLNSYQFIDGGGVRMLILHLETNVPEPALVWAQGILKKHPKLPTVLTTHIHLNPKMKGRPAAAWQAKKFKGKVNSAQAVWTKLIRPNPQVFLTLSGHYANPPEYHQVNPNDAGKKVIEVIADYQTRKNGGDGWLRLIRFDPPKDEISFRTYSPSLDKFETDASSQFTLPYEIVRSRL